MGRFEPVLIEREGGHYSLRQGDRTLLKVPNDIFESYNADAVFPPMWSQKGGDQGEQEPRYILWHPSSGEFLMGPIRPRPPLLAEVYGSHPFRAYLQVFWMPLNCRLILRTYWNPENPSESFGPTAKKDNFRVQAAFTSIFARLLPPPAMTTTLNAIDRYQRIAGLDGVGEEADPAKIARLYVAPAASLEIPNVAEALRAMAVDFTGRLFPVLGANSLRWVEALAEGDLAEARKIFDRFGVHYSLEAFVSH